MSHLNTNSITNTVIISYDPKEYRKRWVRKNFWLIAGMASSLGWVYLLTIMFTSGNLLGVIAVAVLAYPAWQMITRSNKEHLDAAPVERVRKLVRRVNAYTRHHMKVENLTWPDIASYVPEVIVPNQNDTTHMLLVLTPRDPNKESLIFDVTRTSITSPKGVDFEPIFSKLEAMQANSTGYSSFASMDGFMKTQFKPKEIAVQSPLTRPSGTELRGD